MYLMRSVLRNATRSSHVTPADIRKPLIVTLAHQLVTALKCKTKVDQLFFTVGFAR